MGRGVSRGFYLLGEWKSEWRRGLRGKKKEKKIPSHIV